MTSYPLHMTSRWLVLVVIMALGAHAGFIQQLEDATYEDLLLKETPVRNVENLETPVRDMLNMKEIMTKAKDLVDREEQENQPNRAASKYHSSPHARRYAVNPNVKKGNKQMKIMEKGLKMMAKQMGYSKEDLKILYDQELSDEVKEAIGCDKEEQRHPECNPLAHYRTIDGTCNNLDNPLFGAANTEFSRLLSSDYGDGVASIRQSVKGEPLTNSRSVSIAVFNGETHPSQKQTLLSMSCGQLLDHELTLAVEEEVDCSKCNTQTEACIPIPIPEGDESFLNRGVQCISVVRDAAAAHPNCKLGKREQVNALTAYMDASMVYGADPVTADRERDLDSDLGLMREAENPNGQNFLPLLPQVLDDPNCASDDQDNEPCFSSGDVRVNENPGLISMQTLFVREHNRIARRLKELKACLTGEQIYQETRKIVGAEFQHIVYKEHLKEILDFETRKKFGLILQKFGYFTGYDPTVNPGITNSFSGAAYRFGHSQVNEVFTRKRLYPRVQNFTDIQTDQFGNPSPIYDVCNGGVDAILTGAFTANAGRVDGSFAPAIRERLARVPGDVADLTAINIQRGRERGIASYNKFREECGLKAFETFDDFIEVMSKDTVKNLKEVYTDPYDVDLWVGGILERPTSKGAAMGPTFSCIIAKQFAVLRTGDRFWYETDNRVTGFSLEQLAEIRKVSLAGIICANSDSIKKIPREAMSAESEIVHCDDIRQIDLRKWKHLRKWEEEENSIDA